MLSLAPAERCSMFAVSRVVVDHDGHGEIALDHWSGMKGASSKVGCLTSRSHLASLPGPFTTATRIGDRGGLEARARQRRDVLRQGTG